MQPEIQRGAMLSQSAGSPLAALFFLIDMGMYPPPELLLALCDDFERYKIGRGKLSLEEAFFGPPLPRVGTHASRYAMRVRRFWITFLLYEKLREGMSLTDSAEAVAQNLDDGTDADAILRANRGLKVYRGACLPKRRRKSRRLIPS